MDRRRVVVTGLGLVAPHGNDPASVFEAICAGRNAIAWDDGLRAVVARSTVDQSPGGRQGAVDRVSRLAIAAGLDALADAGWIREAPPWPVDRTGIHVGTGFGGTESVAEAARRFNEHRRMPPLSVVAAMANAPAAHLALRTGITGPVLTSSIACASSSVAIAAAAKDILLGEIDAALVGGTEAPLVGGMVASWQAMQTLAQPHSDDPSASSRPFSASRSGLVLGEGAAFLVIEELEVARRRGARIYAELAGSGASCDAMHLTKPDVDGQVKAMRAALRQAGVVPSDVTYCNAHGTATTVGDAVEARSIGALWGDRLDTLRVSSTKSMHGHLLGAAGALEALLTVLAVHHGRLPPNANCDDRDPACALPLVVEAEPIDRPDRIAISNSFAFGGTNSSLVFRNVH